MSTDFTSTSLVMSDDGFVDVIDDASGELVPSDLILAELLAYQADVGCEFDEKMRL